VEARRCQTRTICLLSSPRHPDFALRAFICEICAICDRLLLPILSPFRPEQIVEKKKISHVCSTDSTDEEKKGIQGEARRHKARTGRFFSSPWHPFSSFLSSICTQTRNIFIFAAIFPARRRTTGEKRRRSQIPQISQIKPEKRTYLGQEKKRSFLASCLLASTQVPFFSSSVESVESVIVLPLFSGFGFPVGCGRRPRWEICGRSSATDGFS